MRVMLVTEEIPRRNVNGALTYLDHFVRYCADRQLDLTLLITGSRFDRLAYRAAHAFPGRVRLRGPGLLSLGGISLVADARAWRHWSFARIVRGPVSSLRGLALRLRTASQGSAAIIGRRLERREAARLDPVLRREAPDILLVNTVFAAPILEVKPAGTRAVLVAHDVMSQRVRALESRGLSVRPRLSEDEERQALRGFDAIIAISDTDAAAFARLAPDVPTHVVLPPVEIDRKADRARGKRCVFLGSASVHNVDGLNWFLEEVWPLVLRAEPEASLDLVGGVGDRLRSVPPRSRRLGHTEKVAAALGEARFAVNPLQAGSGLKIKMLDYFAQHLPVVSTSIGAEGFPRDEQEPFVVADRAEDFAAAVIRWMSDPADVSRYAARCPAYAALFSEEAMFRSLDRALGIDGRRAC